MKDQCKMPDLVQRHDPREPGAIHQRLDRRRHDRVIIAENSNLGRTRLTVRKRRAERDERAYCSFWRTSRVAPGYGAAQAVADQMNALAAGVFLRDAPESRRRITDRLPSRVLEMRHVVESRQPQVRAKRQ